MKTFEDYGIEVPHRRGSVNVKTFCPKCREQRHDKRDKSLSVNVAEGVWNCHYCGWGGHLGYTDAEKEAYKRKMTEERQRNAPQREYTKPVRTDGVLDPYLRAQLNNRKISDRTLETFGVTGDDRSIHFNYYLDGELTYIKYRSKDKKFYASPGARVVPYNLDSCLGQDYVIVTEGEIDAMSFHEAGYTSVVSVASGGSSSMNEFNDFWETHFEDKETVYIAVDTDDTGDKAREELVRRFGADKCKIVTYDGLKDANELLQRDGVEALRKAINTAKDIPMAGVFTLSDLRDEFRSIVDFGLPPGVDLKIPALDKFITFEPGRLCIVTGFPGSGKSEFIDEMAVRFAYYHGWSTAFFSPENHPIALHMTKIAEKVAGMSVAHLKENKALQKDVEEWIDKNFSFIDPEEYTVDEILKCATWLVKKKGIKMLVIDPYNRIEHQRGTMSETDYVSLLLDKFSRFAAKHKVLVTLMAHPRKPEKTKNGKIEPPTLYDISGSANFFNKADYGIVIHRNRAEGTVEVYIQKVKFKHHGSAQTEPVILLYHLESGRYYEQGGIVNPHSYTISLEEHAKADELRNSRSWRPNSNFEEAPF